eukprot:CAMPEP_0114580066 /NCGR_PEP_ID=MMETSP0125-20121206/4398_1 /TAXON_ID=485358 ORGANISM="Aristerostoma sp., Strain ATCC 50986" /NCGR_SAMPLE_ID=MMETSP0125 /ASSEMBLY_ACC=CAM_ASM_000245 /LENGTH=44 /DNA_ID= /DNA_START= /DNA_END= /DNA_ORIENTATION=
MNVYEKQVDNILDEIVERTDPQVLEEHPDKVISESENVAYVEKL